MVILVHCSSHKGQSEGVLRHFFNVFTDNLNVICSYINFICFNKTYLSILAVMTTIYLVIGKIFQQYFEFYVFISVSALFCFPANDYK